MLFVRLCVFVYNTRFLLVTGQHEPTAVITQITLSSERRSPSVAIYLNLFIITVLRRLQMLKTQFGLLFTSF